MAIYKFSVQTFFLSLVISGFWLWEISLPAKLVGAGLVGMILVVTQEELPYFIDMTLARLAGIDVRLRVIERSIELSRIEPNSSEPAERVIAEELESANRVRTLWEKVSPPAIYDLLAMVTLVALASGLALLWISLLANRVF